MSAIVKLEVEGCVVVAVAAVVAVSC